MQPEYDKARGQRLIQSFSCRFRRASDSCRSGFPNQFEASVCCRSRSAPDVKLGILCRPPPAPLPGRGSRISGRLLPCWAAAGPPAVHDRSLPSSSPIVRHPARPFSVPGEDLAPGQTPSRPWSHQGRALSHLSITRVRWSGPHQRPPNGLGPYQGGALLPLPSPVP